ncbi:Dipeptidyl aminopeptidase/acylaminoacyl peptidase, partial [Globisporangium splendens]
MPLSQDQLEQLPEAIPLKVLFGNPDKRLPRLSPDGKFYAYLADASDGVTNVFLKAVKFASNEESKDAAVLEDTAPQQLTTEDHRPVRIFFWSKSVTQYRIFYLQDKGGDENFHLYVAEFSVDEAGVVHKSVVRDLTPFDGVTVDLGGSVNTSKDFPDHVIVSINKRDPKFFDAYKIHIPTGDLELEVENPGDVAGWIVNADFQVWGASIANPTDGSETLRVRPSLANKDAATWKSLATWPHGETCVMHKFNKDNTGVYVQTSLSHQPDGSDFNTSRFVLLSVEDGTELDVLAHDLQCDVSSVWFNDNSHEPEYAVFDYTKPRIEVLDDSVRTDIYRLQALVLGHLTLVSASDDNLTWLYADIRDDASLKYYIFLRRSGQHALLFDSQPELSKYTLAPMTPYVIQTSDNEDMVLYLTLPVGIKTENLPFVLNVHGGPWGRDSWGLNPTHQLFANRGYGVISVNFRASAGLGKRWCNLGDQQWGATMQQDLTDTVEWAVQQGYADKDRVAIYGGSYGGYAVLAGLAFTPDVYVCGVDIVGPSHIKTLLQSIPPYWEPMKKMLQLRVGDVENDQALNERISPFYHADKITKPLLIAQGKNDPRVKQAESDQIAKKLFENKHDVQYILYTDEGHGFARPANKLEFISRVETFFVQYLGGRKLPLDESLIEGNSAVEIDVSAL